MSLCVLVIPEDFTKDQEECGPKETYYAEQRGVLSAPYEGREILGKEAAANYKPILVPATLSPHRQHTSESAAPDKTFCIVWHILPIAVTLTNRGRWPARFLLCFP
jgi:hypothetical protein